MKRKLSNIFAGVCLLLAIVLGCLWVRSYWISDYLLVGSLGFDISHGEFSVGRWRYDYAPGEAHMPAVGFVYSESNTDSESLIVTKTPTIPNQLGFQLDVGQGSEQRYTVHHFRLVWPGWLTVGLLLIWPVVWTIRSVRRLVWMLTTRCGACGYDLRGTPIRCPECGTVRGGGAERAG